MKMSSFQIIGFVSANQQHGCRSSAPAPGRRKGGRACKKVEPRWLKFAIGPSRTRPHIMQTDMMQCAAHATHTLHIAKQGTLLILCSLRHSVLLPINHTHAHTAVGGNEVTRQRAGAAADLQGRRGPDACIAPVKALGTALASRGSRGRMRGTGRTTLLVYTEHTGILFRCPMVRSGQVYYSAKI